MRLVSFILFLQTQDYIGLSYLTVLVVSLLWSLAILLFAPYKRSVYNKFEGIFALYYTIIFGFTLYNITLEILLQKPYYTEVMVYVVIFLPSIAAMIGFSISICRLCCGCSWFHSKFSPTNAIISSSSITSTISYNMARQRLINRSVNVFRRSSSDQFYTRDRVADQIGFSMP